MEKLGVWLRQTREAQGSTLEEAEAATRIRAHFLELLEAGDFAAFPGGDVQVRGFLRIYARHLELPVDDVLARYRAEVKQDGPAETALVAQEKLQSIDDSDEELRPFQPRDIPVSSTLPRWMSVETVLIVGALLILLLVIVAVASYVMSQDRNERTAAAATITATVPSEIPRTSRATPSPPAIVDTMVSTISANAAGDVTLTLEATEHVWVRVMQGEQTVFEGVMTPGQTETWSDPQRVAVETGNGAGVQVTVNDQPQGTLCGRGEVCIRAWDASS